MTAEEREKLRQSVLENARKLALPLPPWTHAALGEEKYCEIARELGYFDPKGEATTYRPDLDPTLFFEVIKEQHKKPVKAGE